jgi:hypothetical protein
MRASLIETCRLLRSETVSLDVPWPLVDGEPGEYSIHRGTAVAHRRPGGADSIIPVHSQRRGRIFLPFADDAWSGIRRSPGRYGTGTLAWAPSQVPTTVLPG